MLKDLLRKSRSYRRFEQDAHIPEEALRDWVDNTRLCPSTSNSQALKFRIVSAPEECAKVYPALRWAGALKDWDGPEEGERPSAYIVILCDLSLGKNKMWDDGITGQTILLSAAEQGFGGCMLASVDRPALAKALGIDTERYAIDLVLALGKPKEEIVLVPMPADGSVNYYRDEKQVHYVPKRALEDLIV